MPEHPAVIAARKAKEEAQQRLLYIQRLAEKTEYKATSDIDSCIVYTIDPGIIVEYKKNLEQTKKISEMIDFISDLSRRVLYVFEQNKNVAIKKDGRLDSYLKELLRIVEAFRLTLDKINI